jgi:hypothetical protein
MEGEGLARWYEIYTNVDYPWYIRRLTDEYTTMYIHRLTNECTGLCSSVETIFLDSSTEEYTIVIFLGTEEYTLFSYSESSNTYDGCNVCEGSHQRCGYTSGAITGIPKSLAVSAISNIQ